ncbi:protocatechuate 3,4-dioxygenase beta subunit [Naumannella cuiyingiana]|uniref:Protocatechuate 3,4-dioxygenase beta subunit n=1 Tax=Naumannella cuiyingiana TaxID=1347891 RepID=A0A7Z0D622_9ACTN|nr:intradiol ring-cleavage dioxygenase [Naumannella cuiyingiana]NYI69581.1 protocatechuate 3,4-dioxygenase beta subunit [Naumannella cuiyingiana]
MNEPTSYRGRPLPRPGEDVEDQGLAFDLGTLFGRRRMLALIGAAGAGLGLAACGALPQAGAEGAGTGEIPDETAGPYPGDGSNGPDLLERSGVLRSDIRSSFETGSATAVGVPMKLELIITDLAAGTPFAGAAVYVWHCDREGRYSMYAEGLEDENYLRGVQVADAEGRVGFTSIFPACYDGRWPHIHFEVYPAADTITDAANAIATSQVALPRDACEAVYATDGYQTSAANLARVSLATDMVFGDDGGASQLATVTGDAETGYRVELTVGVDTRTAPATGGGGPGGAVPRASGAPPQPRR